MTMLLGESAPLSAHVRNWAEETRVEARGYRDMRNIVAIGIVGTTAIVEGLSTMSVVHRIEFGAGGVAVAALAALGMEYGRRREERRARGWDRHAEELASLNM